MIYFQQIDENHLNNPWIVMVHGFSHDSRYFTAQVPEFKYNYRILLVDLRGHGHSSNILESYGLEEYADDLAEVLETTGINSFHYWGTHTGAVVGIILALRCPDKFRSLILEGGFFPGFPMPRVDELYARARSLAQSQGVQAALEDWLQHADWFAYIQNHPKECRADEHNSMTRAFTGGPWLSPQNRIPLASDQRRCSSLKIPLLVYNGVQDLPDFKKAAEYLQNLFPLVELREIPHAGGFPAWENPDMVNSIVRKFILAATKTDVPAN